jgi:hypothetical protein
MSAWTVPIIIAGAPPRQPGAFRTDDAPLGDNPLGPVTLGLTTEIRSVAGHMAIAWEESGRDSVVGGGHFVAERRVRRPRWF